MLSLNPRPRTAIKAKAILLKAKARQSQGQGHNLVTKEDVIATWTSFIASMLVVLGFVAVA